MSNSGFEKLNDSNYVDWRHLMEALLIKKKVWDVVDGSLTRPLGSANSKPVKAFLRKQQIAWSTIILNVEASQLPHTRFDDSDPHKIWRNLEKIHWSHRFTTRLSLRRHFLYMRKRDDQPMDLWIADVKNVAARLEAAGIAVTDQDIILTLTQGLPDSYATFIVTLDNIPPDSLTLDYVVTRLLNEEARQNRNLDMGPSDSINSAPTGSAKRRRPIEKITCYNCGGKGHYQSACPSVRKESAAVSAMDEEGDDFAF